MVPQLVRFFSVKLRARGDSYVASRRVRITSANSRELTALVTGTQRYEVEISAKPGQLSGTCSCPYAADNGVCKHLWATIRQASLNHSLAPLEATLGRHWSFQALSDRDYFDGADIDANIDDGNEGNDGDLDADAAGLNDDEPDANELIGGLRIPQRELYGKLEHTHPRAQRSTPKRPPAPGWRTLLETARTQMSYADAVAPAVAPVWPADRRIVYVVDLAASAVSEGVVIALATEKRDRDGEWRAPVQFAYPASVWEVVPDAQDRQLSQLLLGAQPPNPYGGVQRPAHFMLRAAAFGTTLRLICETGRCRLLAAHGEPAGDTVRWDDGPLWSLHLRVAGVAADAGAGYVVEGVLRRAGEEMPLSEPVMLHSEGVLLARNAFARLDHHGAFAMVPGLRSSGPVRVPDAELPGLLESLFSLPHRPALDLPPHANVAERRIAPQPGVAIGADPSSWRNTHHALEPFFQYDTVRVASAKPGISLFDRKTLTLHHRDAAFEAAALAHLASLGARPEYDYRTNGRGLAISAKKLAQHLPALVAAGWRVEAEGAVYRAASQGHAAVRSGVDWFELAAGVRFGDIGVSLPDLLAARRTGATTIVLSDGSRGVLPLDWLARLGPLAAGGEVVDGVLRYTRSQATLLDAMLATLPEPDVDATFERIRTELRSFESVAPMNPPRTFRGTLREYQREGLGWLDFLRRFALGGCLADDMGLGKTVQVLAMLDARRDTPARPRRPSIVVVPRSLVFNWLREAERFTPRLRVLDHSGTDRSVDAITGGSVDLMITTYGTLRRDAATLAPIQFDYAILDEAQAIKTAGTASAKAARLLRAEHRLALTGTPIENRIEELWSLLEFLNPGMLGTSSSFATLARLGSADQGAPTGRDVLARALRPLILRRTKEKVASELPARLEQTLAVKLEGKQRKFYDDLLEAYRRSVLDRVDRVGMGKAKMHIFEALLRLRQAACHPVLADPRKADAPSAKLDALIPTLAEVVAEGHKALVFSQFTGFLALVRTRLDASGICYEYLDGGVRNRQARVDRFQNDAACPVFLISLKAGGHGLNLTAADYVYILDPWWNPAVEAQAIDRAHRIGQARRVIATRIVAERTIEQKILELQASKRALADAILGQDQGVLAGIGRAELEMLLG